MKKRYCLPGAKRMRRCLASLLALALCVLAPGARAEAVVGADIAMEDIAEFYYTIDAPLAESFTLRYRLYTENGEKRLYHETRQGGAWPQTEEDTVFSGTAALTDADWEALCDCLRDGYVKSDDGELNDGDDGPWMYLRWTGDGGESRAFEFASIERQAGFEALCSRLAGNHVLTRFCFTLGGSMVPRTSEITLCNGEYRIQNDDGEPRAFSPALAAELERVIAEYDLEAWDGFSGSNPNVLDGESFSLTLTCADGSTVYASGENAFPERYHDAVDDIMAILEEDRLSHIAGVYRYEGDGFGGDFTITLNADGTYAYYEGALSSYMGGGTWSEYYDTVYMTEENGFDAEYMFVAAEDALIYIESGSDAFPYVEVSDGERFVRQDGTE